MLPTLVHIGPFTLYSFGLMVILGFLAGLAVGGKLARERGLPGEAWLDGAVFILFAGIAGARLLYVALNWKSFSGHLLNVGALWQGGMSFHGGVIAAVAAGVLYMRHRKIPILAMADAGAPGIALGYAIGRVGCFLNGCCYGTPTDLPWGIVFPHAETHVASHPTQLYATVLNLLLMGGLIALYRRPHRVGQVMAAYVVGYSVYRFLIESLRKGVTAEVLAFGLTEAQVFSLVCVALGIAWWAWLQKRGQPAEAVTVNGGHREAPTPVDTPAGTL
jgi:phosphatidylglycerol:prolipoprotein diacylglycerol transferase